MSAARFRFEASLDWAIWGFALAADFGERRGMFAIGPACFILTYLGPSTLSGDE